MISAEQKQRWLESLAWAMENPEAFQDDKLLMEVINHIKEQLKKEEAAERRLLPCSPWFHLYTCIEGA